MSSSTALKKPGAHLNKSLWEKCDHHLLQRDFTATDPLGKLKSSFRKELERWRSKFHFSSDFTFEVLFSSVRTFYLEPHLAKRLGAARLLVDHQCLGNFLIRWPPNLFFPSLLRQASSFPAHFLFHFNWLLLSISNFIILSLNFYFHILKFFFKLIFASLSPSLDSSFWTQVYSWPWPDINLYLNVDLQDLLLTANN